MTICERAPAKINLGLNIIGKRPDGFHDIVSIFLTVGLSDNIIFTCETSEHHFRCDDPSVPTDDSNLVLRAEEVFLDKFDLCRKPDYTITLEKNIPMGAGMGGGSSDAAAALRGLAAMYEDEVAPSYEELHECATQLGSDVPFFIKGGAAVVRGRGEIIEPFTFPFDFQYVLVFPDFGVSTAWAYKNLDTASLAGGSQYDNAITGLRQKKNMISEKEFLRVIKNDFEKTVFTAHPELESIKKALLDCNAETAFMTGSGSTMVGIFNDIETAETCKNHMQEQGFRSCVVEKEFRKMNV